MSYPWHVNEMAEAVGMAVPPPYSCDPNGNDLPEGMNLGHPCSQTCQQLPCFFVLFLGCVGDLFSSVVLFFTDYKVIQYYFNLGVQVCWLCRIQDKLKELNGCS